LYKSSKSNGIRTINSSKRNQAIKKYQKSTTTSLSESVGRIVYAQRLKNDELQNRVNELKTENEKLLDENKVLKRMHKREEIAIKRYENQDSDITRIVKNHIEEANVLKATIKKIKSENKKLYNNLIEKDEEIRSLKKKVDEMKKMLNEKKMFDIVDLSKQLDESKKDLSSYKEKYEVIF
jgi:hypothetical protein